MTTESINVRLIRKGDRFYNKYQGCISTATTDAVRRDGRDGKSRIALCQQQGDGSWQTIWYQVECGVQNDRGGYGMWSALEHEQIEVERA